MKKVFCRLLEDDRGAVTVDWVVLCAGVVLMAVVIFDAMQSGSLGLADSITAYMDGWDF
ncbi:hypothetical protein [Sulfitobacter sabulilitoris]|uniref:hypothetical protein n=1 Tax=Sulfitobacter sabulilitoris TaxID=2562655 RepID=UPI0014785020|nr:hypothetical protein [Sulfitobacter sabulilitoris]